MSAVAIKTSRRANVKRALASVCSGGTYANLCRVLGKPDRIVADIVAHEGDVSMGSAVGSALRISGQ
jgi:hypothetical protein